MSARAPRLAVRWLERWLPEDERVEVIGDLDEEFDERVASHGAGRATRWYWRQTCVLLWHRRRLGSALDHRPPTVSGVFADSGADWRHAWRSIRRAPAFSSVALLSLVVSLGMATGVFSIVNAVLLEPLPFTTADRIVRLGTIAAVPDGSQARVATVGGAPPPPRLVDVMVGAWLEKRQTLDAMTTCEAFAQTVTLDDVSMRIGVADVGPEFFQVLPVQAIAGRTLQPLDGAVGAPRVAVISQRLVSQHQVDGAGLVGKTITIGDAPHVIAGILPADFDWPDQTVDVWVVDRTRWPAPGTLRQMGRYALTLGLMRPGVTPDDVQREGQQLANDLTAAGASLSRQSKAVPTVVARRLKDELIQPVWPALVLLITGTLGVLIAANVNLAGFLLSRNTSRRRELAVRQALGASSWRLIRPLVCEQLLLGGIGAVGALSLAWILIRVLPRVAPHDLPRLSAVSLDGMSLLFASIAALTTAVAIGLLPARRLASSNLRVIVADGGAAMAGAGRQSEQTRRVLVVCQVSVATLLLVGSALVGRSLLAMLHIDVGYEPAGVLTFQVGNDPGAAREPGRLSHFYEALFDRLRAESSVVSLGTSTALPLHGDTTRASLTVPGLTPPRTEGVPWPTAHMEYVGATYLQTIGARLTAGRWFTEHDRLGAAPAVIVNDAFVRVFMPGANPLGQVIPYGVHRPTVVGVIVPIKRAASTVADDPAIYIPAGQGGEFISLYATRGMGTAVRTTGDPMALVPLIRDIVRDLEPSAPVYNAMALDDRVGRTLAQPRFFVVALGVFAILALATALLGVYGVLAATVERRRVELGVRRALGATTRDIGALVLGQAVRLSVVGLGIGLSLAAGGSAIGRSALYGISSSDVVSYASASVAVLAVVLLGAWVPMRSALRVDPARVLRAD